MFLPLCVVPAVAGDERPSASRVRIVPADWQAWLERWWVEPELEWDDRGSEGVDFSVDAEIGHMLTDRLGLWGRPVYRTDADEPVEDWQLRIGIRYRLN